MDNLRKGTKEANKDRIAKGIEPIEIIGWIEKPTYDATNHRLIWCRHPGISAPTNH